MFQSAYQDGDCVEVFSPAGKNPAAQWKLSGKVVRLYEKGVKGYVLTVSGGATSKMQLPKAPKGLLGLRQRHLVLQVMTATSQDKPFSLELGLTDAGGTRRRLVLSSSFRTLHCTPLHAQIPLVGLDQHRGSWANLSVDLVGLTAVCFRAEAFRTLDLLAIGPTCRLRKIFTMKEALDDASGEDGEGDAQDEPNTTASVPATGPKDSGGCGPAAVAAVPLRMTFPAGVVPAPRNWVISVSTLRRLAIRDVPPPSPSKRNHVATACSGRGRKVRSTPSPRQTSFGVGPPSLTSTTASLYVPEERPSVRSRPGGTAERGTTSPGLLEIVAGKPSSNSSSRASAAGLVPRHRPSSSRGSSSSSTRPRATPSPVATPERRTVIARTSNIADRHGPGIPSSSSSPNSGTMEYSTPGSSTGRDGVGTSRVAKEGSTASFGRSGTDDTRLFRRSSSQKPATTPGSTIAQEENCDEVEGTGGGGMLPARQRVSKALLPGGRTLEMRQTGIADGGASSEKGGGGGQMTQAPGEKLRVASSWNEGQDKHAPAWSFLSGNENENSCPDNMSRMASQQPKRACSLGSPLASSPTELATAPACNSRSRSASRSIADLEKYTTTSGLEGNKERGRTTAEEPSSLQDLREALPADIDVSWRGEQYGDDRAAVASATRSVTSARRASPEAEKKATRTSARSRPSSSCTTTAITSDSAASIPTARGTCGHPSPSASVVRRESDVAKKTTATHLFASPFSPLGEGEPATHHSSHSSNAMGRSPMSARVDVLRNLLAPIAMGEQGLIQKDTIRAVSAGAEENNDEVDVSTSTAATVPKVRDGGSNVVVAFGEKNADDADALELLLGHSVIAGDTTTSTRSDNGSPTTNAASGFVDGIAKHAAYCLDDSAGSSSYHQRATDIDRPRTTESKGIATRPNQTREGFGVHASTTALDRGHGLGGKATPLRVNSECGATARLFGGGQGSDSDDRGEIGLMRPYSARSKERYGGQKAGPRMDMDERPDKLEELERKEIALFDLEESYHTEFGSVDLSQSPEKRSQFIVHSPARSSAAAVNMDTIRLMTPKVLRSNCDTGKPNRGSFSPITTLDHRQQSNESHVSNGDEAADSVVLGSRGSTTSAPSKEGVDPEAICGRARSQAEGIGVAKTETRDQKERGNDELYFDPVLNCYYDRVADKYYGLC